MSRIALVTGGARGIGRAAIEAFAGAGMTIAVADIAGEAAAEAARAIGAGHRGYALDVRDEAQVAAVFDAVERELGPVAVLANFAGILIWPQDTRPRIVDTPAADWEETFAVNARGTFLTIREMLRRRAALPVQDGRIINISSSAAQLGGYNASAAYVASKAAILGLTKSAAREGAPLGITVNAIAPGTIDTPLLRTIMPRERDAAYVVNVPLGRIGMPADIAAAALYLSSPEAGYVTGSCIDVNGGIRMQ